MPELIRNLWQLKTAVFMHWCLIHAVPFHHWAGMEQVWSEGPSIKLFHISPVMQSSLHGRRVWPAAWRWTSWRGPWRRKPVSGEASLRHFRRHRKRKLSLEKGKTIILQNDYNRTRIYAQPWLIVVRDSVISKPVCLSQPVPSTLVFFGIKAPIFPEPVFPKDFISFLSPSFIKAKLSI